MSSRRVVVTGLGIVSPVGSTIDSAWNNLSAGVSGISRIEAFDPTEFSVQIAGAVKGFNADDYIPKKDQKKMDPFIHYGLGAGVQAIKDSGLEITEDNAERIGVLIGSGIGGLPGIEKSYASFMKNGPRKISPFFVPSNIVNMVAGNLSIMFGLQGPNMSIVSACASGTHSIGDAARMIAYGDVDAMVAGGAEMASCHLGVGGFAAARALCASHNDDPEGASRPWDKGRDGFVLGDGAGVLMLEEYETAKARGARIYCELVGYGMSSDAHHMTQPAAGGLGAARCMRNALRDAELNADQVNYVNAHGTSTPLGDVIEARAVARLLGDAVNDISMSSTKSATGHLLGAAGAIEAIFSLKAVQTGEVPPTLNLNDAEDAVADFDLVPLTSKKRTVRNAMSNSFGFGGTNASLIMGQVT